LGGNGGRWAGMLPDQGKWRKIASSVDDNCGPPTFRLMPTPPLTPCRLDTDWERRLEKWAALADFNFGRDGWAPILHLAPPNIFWEAIGGASGDVLMLICSLTIII
jgi:hypothetical protein